MGEAATLEMTPPPGADEFASLRKPPHSVEAEQSVLGALLLDGAALALILDKVTEAHFYDHAHRLIFGEITRLAAARAPADVVTVYERLQAQGQDEAAGGLVYLNALAQSVPSAANIRRYAEIVADYAAQRALISGMQEAVDLSWDQSQPLDARIERVAAVLRQVEKQRQAPSRHRVPLMGLAELRQASASVRWLVKHVIPADSIGMLYGGSGTFKSFIALDAALHVAHGLPFMGRKTAKGPVLYIAAEGGAGLWPRIEAWHRDRGLRWQGVPLYVVPAAIDLAADAWRVVEAAQIVGVAPALVVVDTLSQTYAGEENSANEMAAYLRELGARFRALWQCSVLIIHHSGHQATERPRGSSAIRANIDYLLGVHRDELERLATVSCVKQKDGDLFSDATFKLRMIELERDEDNDPVTSLVARHLGTAEEIAEAGQAEAEAGRGGRDRALMGMVSNGMPERDLRRAFYETLDGLDSHAKKQAYYRARDRAVKARLMEVAEGFIIDLRGKQ
jgi:hypothetical protein